MFLCRTIMGILVIFSIQMTVTGGIIYGNTRLYIVAVGSKTNALSLILHRISFHQDTGSAQVTAFKSRCHAV